MGEVEVRPNTWVGEEYRAPVVRYVRHLDEVICFQLGGNEREYFRVETINGGFVGIDSSVQHRKGTTHVGLQSFYL